MREIPLNGFQRLVLAVPEQFDVFLGCGRGGGKSYALVLLALRHAEQYRDRARILYLRKTHKGLADFELITRKVFGTVYRDAASYNAQEHVWRLPNGAYMELGQLESHGDYPKYQGWSFTLLEIDEAGEYADPSLLDMLRSNLRGPRAMPIPTVIAANPGGVGHYWAAKRYVFRAAPWTSFVEEKSNREWMYAPSTLLDNQFIDQDEYRRSLEVRRIQCEVFHTKLKALRSRYFVLRTKCYEFRDG